MNPVNKEQVASELSDVRRIFGKSIVAARDLAGGSVLTGEDLTVRKPGTGVPANRMNEMLSRRLRRSLQAGEFLQENDVELGVTK
jgi:N-acetylneuraminate synthase